MKRWHLLFATSIFQCGISAYEYRLHLLQPGVKIDVLWLPIAIPALSFLATFFMYRTDLAALRKKEGLCDHCGYDLRATPERCPECGNVPKS